MGINKNRFKTDIEDEFLCPLCQQVFDDPVQAGCQHDFCRKCLEQRLIKEKNCPIDNEKIIERHLKTNNLLIKLLSKLQLTCEFASLGCDQVISLSSLPFHTAECRHNPDLAQACGGGCGVQLTKQQVNSHRCVEVLNKKIVLLEEEVKKCRLEKEEVKSNLNQQKLLINQLDQTVSKLKGLVENKNKENESLQKTMSEIGIKTEKLEKWQNENIQANNYQNWLRRFPKSKNKDFCNFVNSLKQKNLISWKVEDVLLRCELKRRIYTGFFGPIEKDNFFNWFTPTVLSTLKDNLSLGSSCLIHEEWQNYLIYCCALMVGPSGRVFTPNNLEFSQNDIGIEFAGETIFNQIFIDYKKKRLLKNDNKVTNIFFDCMISKIDKPMEKFVDLLKLGGRIIKVQSHFNSFVLIEKLMDGSVRQSEVNRNPKRNSGFLFDD